MAEIPPDTLLTPSTHHLAETSCKMNVPTLAELLEKWYGTSDSEAVAEQHEEDRCMLYPSMDNMVSMDKFPYYRAGCTDLPTVAEIEQAFRDRAAGLRSYPTQSDVHVCRLGKYVAKKCKSAMNIFIEANNLLFLEDYEVRTPKLFAAWAVGPEYYNDGYLVMEYIEGQQFTGQLLSELEPAAIKIIGRKFAEQIRLLRSIPNEGDEFYSTLNRKGFPPWNYFLSTHKSIVNGPYNSYKALIDAFCDTLELSTVMNTVMASAVMGASKGTKATFTHLDLKFENMIVRPIKSEDGATIEDWEVTLIDWHECAWLPEWTQFVAIQEKFARGWLYEEYEQHTNLLWDYFLEHFEETFPQEREFMHKCNKAGLSFLF
ncbi:hypothetical protein CC80DRAFT_302969 [Byssothecium circinans]|uniref:Aminoglycoside phosphotransferase domain-containing protein n=1 Tax=Byssothecium circinans TaxID=147558 RepID=A0A6A5UEL0_9PLEO|nr:hypothetical protein CC80DRAFT_302969 [Byssothecium circinans]